MVQQEIPFKIKLSKTQELILSVLPDKSPGLIGEEVRDLLLVKYPEKFKGMLVDTASRRLRELVGFNKVGSAKIKMVESEKTYMRFYKLS